MMAEPVQSRVFALAQEQRPQPRIGLPMPAKSPGVACGIVKRRRLLSWTSPQLQLPARHSGRTVETRARARESFWSASKKNVGCYLFPSFILSTFQHRALLIVTFSLPCQSLFPNSTTNLRLLSCSIVYFPIVPINMKTASILAFAATAISSANALFFGFNLGAQVNGHCRSQQEWEFAFNKLASFPGNTKTVRLYAASDCNTLANAVPAAGEDWYTVACRTLD